MRAYINSDGFLMSGLDGRSTSMVEGVRCDWSDVGTLGLSIDFVNDLGDICGTKIVKN